MKYLFKIAATFLVFTIVSCEKVIDIDLNNSNPKHVIKAILMEGTHDFTVSITKTTSYFNPTEPEKVNNATVILYDENNAAYNLTSKQNGLYDLSSFTAFSEKNYRLSVAIEGTTYEATANVPVMVPIDTVSLGIEEDEEEEEEYLAAFVDFKDPADASNYYQLEHRINSNEYEPTRAYVVDDFAENGSTMSQSVYVDERAQLGDTVHVELRSIDKGLFDFFSTLESTIEGGGDGPGSTAPANPTTNWNNGALGYFGGGNSDFKTVILK